MAVVTPFRDVRLQPGAPNAFVTYWNSWLDTRGQLNEYVLKSRIAALSPDDHPTEMLELQKRISDLMKLKADILNDGAKAHAAVLNSQVQGQYRKEAAYAAVESAATKGAYDLARTKMEVAKDLTIAGMEREESRREEMPGPETARLAESLAAQLTGGQGAIPTHPADAAEQARNGALKAEQAGDPGPKQDYVTFRLMARLNHAANTAPTEEGRAAARAGATHLGMTYFGTDDQTIIAQDLVDKWGSANLEGETKETIRDVLSVGGVSRGPPDVSVRSGTSVGTGVRGPGGQAAPAARGVPAATEAAAPAPAAAAAAGAPGTAGTLPSPELPADTATTSPLAIALGLTPEIDARIAQAQEEMATLAKERDEARARQAAAGPFPGFTRNVFTEPLMAAAGTHPNQHLVQLAAENDPTRLNVILDELGRAGGDPKKALENIRAQGGLPAQAPRVQAIGDPGQMVGSWFDNGLRAAMAGAASPDAANQAASLRVLSELAQAAENNSDTLKLRAPGLQDWLATAAASAASGTPYLPALGKAREAAQGMLANDLHFSELVGDAAGVVVNARTPEEKVASARWFADWVTKNPTSLAGQWSDVAPRLVGTALKEGRGRDMLRDVQNMQTAAYRFADTEPEKEARRRALEAMDAPLMSGADLQAARAARERVATARTSQTRKALADASLERAFAAQDDERQRLAAERALVAAQVAAVERAKAEDAAKRSRAAALEGAAPGEAFSREQLLR